MADNPIPLKLKKTEPPNDAIDMDSLWLDPKLGDGLVDINFHSVPIGKPKNFFRVNPDPAYRRLTELYTHKIEGQIDEQHYIIAKPMRGQIEEAQPCTLTTVVYRDGSVRLWPLKLPKDGGHDNEAWSTARAAAKTAFAKWVKLVWVQRAYMTRDALDGYAPDPDYSKLPPFDELVTLAFGANGIISNKEHRIYKDLFGAPAKPKREDDDGLS